MQPQNDDRYIVSLDIFEGPLDLLLHLIRKHELDIFDIPIAFITKRYLEYLDIMKDLNLDVASEHLDMAANLAFIKSSMMLPQEQTGDEEMAEEGADPREELVRRLLEYQKYKVAAEELASRPQLGRDTFPKAAEEISFERELYTPGLFALMEAFRKLVQRAGDETVHEVTLTRISVIERIGQLVDVMRDKRRLTFDELFDGQRAVQDLVVTFLSLLEMTKIGLLRVHQTSALGEIYVTAQNIEEAEQIISEKIPEEPT